MQNLVDILKKKLSGAIEKAFSPDLDKHFLLAEVEKTGNDLFGHYQCNSAFKLAKLLRTSPRDAAKKILDALESQDMIDSVEIAGAGFINIKFSPKFLAEEMQKLISDDRLGVGLTAEKKKIIVEFSSPNIAKELHVGHLRSSIIGDCLARLFEFLGYDVLRLNHIGDWGTQFGMLIAYMREHAPLVFTGQEEVDLPTLMSWYKAAKKRFDEDTAFKNRSQKEVVSLQGGDESSLAAWKKICEISRKAFQEIYDLLDIRITERIKSLRGYRVSKNLRIACDLFTDRSDVSHLVSP